MRDGIQGRNWRQLHKSMEPIYLESAVQAGGGGVLMWGMLTLHTLGSLIPILTSFDCHSLIKTILEDHAHCLKSQFTNLVTATSSVIMDPKVQVDGGRRYSSINKQQLCEANVMSKLISKKSIRVGWSSFKEQTNTNKLPAMSSPSNYTPLSFLPHRMLTQTSHQTLAFYTPLDEVQTKTGTRNTTCQPSLPVRSIRS